MAQFTKVVFCFLMMFLTSCAQQAELNNGESQWDFDHNLQFSETLISDNIYHIEIIPNDKTNFSRLATF